MKNSIVVYRITSEIPTSDDMNFSFSTVRQLELMGIIERDRDNYKVIREGDTTVTVYSYRKV